MSNNSYHHGNLKNALIEAGIEMVNEGGTASLSLRKVAAKCGVSNAAPYAHFAGKEEMTQKDVADFLGISQSYISRLEKRIIKKLKMQLNK